MKTYSIEENGFRSIYKGIPPFMKYEKGFGYYGVLLEKEETGELQCHLCGHTCLNIAQHLRHKHQNITAKDYRIETGLSLTTPLMSESTRKKIKNNFLNLTEKKQAQIIKRLQRLNKELHKNYKKQRTSKASLEVNNKYGTCPEQVKSQFISIYNQLGRIPNRNELSHKLRYIIEDRFGSYEEAVVAWGISRQEYKEHKLNGQNNAYQARKAMNFFPKYSDDQVRRQYNEFFELNNRFPTWGEVQQYGMPSRAVFERVFGVKKSSLQRSLIQVQYETRSSI